MTTWIYSEDVVEAMCRFNSLPAPYIASEAPKGGSNQQADVLSQLQEGTLEVKFVHDRRKDEANDNL